MASEQIILWVLGGMTALIGMMWKSLNAKIDKVENRLEKLDQKLSNRIDKLDEKLTDIDRRVCRMEGAFSRQECCVIKQDSNVKKAE